MFTDPTFELIGLALATLLFFLLATIPIRQLLHDLFHYGIWSTGWSLLALVFIVPTIIFGWITYTQLAEANLLEYAPLLLLMMLVEAFAPAKRRR